jgi:lysozyme family protein
VSFFLQAFAIVVGEEGGYVNDPQDPGGETKYGITKLEYPNVDIAQLTLAQAQQIYQRDYWNKIDADSLPWEMALVMFDCAVNQGVAAAQAVHKTTSTAAEFQAERALRYMRAETFPRFGRGWMRRLFNVFKLAQVTPQ